MIRLPNNNDVYLIASTRFTSDTWFVNQNYRKRQNIPVVYGANIPIRKIYPLCAIVFVFEMNNTTNQIEGIGRIRNRLCVQERKRIYTTDAAHSEFNAYFYEGKKWVSRTTIMQQDPELLVIFEHILFKKKTHMKRQTGITVVTEHLLDNWMVPILVKEGMQKLMKRILRLFDQPQKQD